jgi:hypothetical protein
MKMNAPGWLRNEIHEIQKQRRISQEQHEQEIFQYQKRLADMTRKLYRAIHYYKVHSYLQSLRLGSDHVSPFIIQRQAILCAILHKEEIVSRQILLLQFHQEQCIAALDSFRSQIIREVSTAIQTLSILIENKNYEMDRFKLQRIQSNDEKDKDNDNDNDNGYFGEMFRKFHTAKGSIATAIQWNTSSCPSKTSPRTRERIGFVANVA